MDSDDRHEMERQAPLRRGHARPKAAGRLAVRVLVQRLSWVEYPLVYWTGTSHPAEGGSPTDTLQRRLHALPAGPYTVCLRRAEPLVEVRSFERFRKALAPTVVEVVPVNASLIARSLRRLIDARRFPALLPKIVGDVAAWRARCDSALRRAREALDAAAIGPDMISRVCLIVGAHSPFLHQARVERTKPLRREKRTSPHATASGAEDIASTRLLSRWPADVRWAAAGAVGPESLLRWARSTPVMNSADVAVAVRDRLLLSPHTVGALLVQLPALLALHERLADEPRRRVQAAVSIQRDAVEAAVIESGATGNPIDLPGAADLDRCRPFQKFLLAYENRLSTSLSQHFELVNDLCADPSPRPGQTRRVKSGLVAGLQNILSAARLRNAVFGTSEPRIRRLVRWSQRGVQRRLFAAGWADPLTFESLPDAAAQSLWTLGQSWLAPQKSLNRSILLNLAGLDVIATPQASRSSWVEACCRVWPPGASGQDHAWAVIVGLYAARVHAGPNSFELVAVALDALAHQLLNPILEAMRRLQYRSGSDAHSSLLNAVRFMCRAIAADVGSNDLNRVWSTMGASDALALVLDHVPSDARRFLEWLGANGDERQSIGLSPSGCAFAFIALGPELFDRLVKWLATLPTVCTGREAFVLDVGDLVLGDECTNLWRCKLPEAAGLRGRRAWVGMGLTALQAVVRRVGRKNEAPVAAAMDVFDRCMRVVAAVADHKMDKDGDAAASRELLTACLRELARRRVPNSPRHPNGFFFGYVGRHLADLVALARGRADRLLAIGTTDSAAPNYVEVDLIGEAWRFLERFDDLPEWISAAAAREGRTARVFRLLSRLGLCLRLRRPVRLQTELAGLAAPVSPPTITATGDCEASSVPLSDAHAMIFRELARWQPGAPLPDRVAEALGRPKALWRELQTLEARSTLGDSARRRAEHIRRLLADPARLAGWIRRDLEKHLPATLDEARLTRLERVAESVIASHFADLLGRPPRAPRDLQDQRNWDNALRLYFTVDANRSLLRRLLAHEARGDRSWIIAQPQNARFVTDVAKYGVDAEAWLSPMRRTVDSPAGPCRIEIETDPLHVLQMGNYFGTCLSEGNFNSFATIANATEVNKRVIYVYDPRGTVVGRKLLVMTRRGQILGFHTYGAFPGRDGAAAGGEANWTQLKAVLDTFCRDLARRCGATLHPYPDGPEAQLAEDCKSLALFAKWYNDGPEAFGADSLRASDARRSKVGGRRLKRRTTACTGAAAPRS